MSTTAIILAAGKGTRMKSDLPKVLHPVCGQPMLSYVMDACRQAGCSRLILVIGHQAEMVRVTYAGRDADVSYVLQQPQQGTGHAVMVCQEELAALSGPVMVLAGDGPLVTADTLKKLLQTHQQARAACTLATCILPEPEKYGRIVRDERGDLEKIVEYLDATESQRAIREVNVSLYCYDAAALREVIGQIRNDNAKGEYYLTDTLSLLRARGAKLAAVAAVPPEEVISINTIEELQTVGDIMSRRAK